VRNAEGIAGTSGWCGMSVVGRTVDILLLPLPGFALPLWRLLLLASFHFSLALLLSPHIPTAMFVSCVDSPSRFFTVPSFYL